MIKLGILGTGDIAIKHLEVFAALDNVEITASYNRTKARAEKAAETFKLGKIYDYYKLMIQENEFDALCIFVASNIIKDVTMDCLELGIPILMEKPPGISVEEAKELENKAKEKGVQIMLGFNRRYMSTIMKAKEEVESDGGLVSINVEAPERWTVIKAKPKFNDEILKSWFYVNGCHCLDLLKYFGGDVTKVTSTPDPEKFYRANVTFSNGALGQYQSIKDNPGNWNITLLTQNKKITLNPLEKVTIQTSGKDVEIKELDETDTKFKPGFFLQNSYFINNIVKDKGEIKAPAVSIKEAVTIMEFMQRVEKGEN